MRIVTSMQHRALAFIEACGRSGYNPAKKEVVLWLDNPAPRSSLMGKPFADLIRSFSREESGANLDHMMRFNWITSTSTGLILTELGRAVLAAAERAEVTEPEASAVVLDSEDPFAYAKLIGHLTKAGTGLLVDPYFRLEQLMTILNGTSITRILLSKQHKRSTQDRAELRVALDSPSLPRVIEVRASADPALHDRMIVGESNVWSLGASLNSVGKVSTVIVPVPEPGAKALRQQASQLWGDADLVGPQPKVPDSSAPSA